MMKQTLILLCTLLFFGGCSTQRELSSNRLSPSDAYAYGGGESGAYTTGQGAAEIAQSGNIVVSDTGGMETTDQASLALRKEEMVVGKRIVSNGGVLVRTVVQTENVSQPVALRREEYVIERIPAHTVNDQNALANRADRAFQGQDIYIALMREEAVASKRTIATEKVNLGKRIDTDRVTVTQPVRTENVEIIKVAGQAASAVQIADVTGARNAAVADQLRLSREELMVGKREVDNGGVRLRKVISTQEASQPVDLMREEYTLNQTAVTDQTADNSNFRTREISLNLNREEPVVGTRNYITEYVRVHKKVETDNQTVTGTLRKESVEIVKGLPSTNSVITTILREETAQGAPVLSSHSGSSVTSGSSEAPLNTNSTPLPGPINTIDHTEAWSNYGGVMQNKPQQAIDLRDPTAVASGTLGAKIMSLIQDQSNIAPTIRNGVVTLRGTVNSATEGNRLVKQISALDGVTSVNNELRVAGKNTSSRGGELLQGTVR